MKWHEWKLAWKQLARHHGYDTFESLDYHLVRMKNKADGPLLTSLINSQAHLRGERLWEMDKRPYYDVYPSVAEALTKVDLSKVMCEHIKLPVDQLLIRLQVGHELDAGRTKIRSIMAIQSHWQKEEKVRGILAAIDDGEFMEDGSEDINHSTTSAILRPGTTIQDTLERGRRPGTALDFDVNNEAVDIAFKLICTLCLLGNNPDLISPEPLEADRKKWEETHDPKLLEKAARRGKRAWSIGKHIEVAPGFRRPHFAVRWMGRGKPVKEPVVRPIRGCLVHRKKIEEVPTGYLDIPLEAIVLDD